MLPMRIDDDRQNVTGHSRRDYLPEIAKYQIIAAVVSNNIFKFKIAEIRRYARRLCHA